MKPPRNKKKRRRIEGEYSQIWTGEETQLKVSGNAIIRHPNLRFSDHIPVQLKQANWTKEKKPNKEKLWIEQLTGSGAQATKFGRWNEHKWERKKALWFYFIYFTFSFLFSFCYATQFYFFSLKVVVDFILSHFIFYSFFKFRFSHCLILSIGWRVSFTCMAMVQGLFLSILQNRFFFLKIKTGKRCVRYIVL